MTTLYKLSLLQKIVLMIFWPVIVVVVALFMVVVILGLIMAWPFLPFLPVNLKLKKEI